MGSDGNKPASRFDPADNPAVIAHLNMIQAIITRLAGNSAQCKTWCFTLVALLFGLAGALKDQSLLVGALLPLIVFALIDAFYLGLERAYRDLFENIAKKLRSETGTYDKSDLFQLKASPTRKHFKDALLSLSVLPIYGWPVVTYLLVRWLGLLP
jgi:hypothetical protein